MNSETTMTKGINKVSKSVIYMGLLALLLGIIAVAFPAGIGKFTAIVIGVFLVLGGIFRLSFAIISFSMGSMILRYLYAILMIVAGIWIIANPEMGLTVLTMVMAVYFIVDGMTEIGYSFSLMPMGGGAYMLLSGIIGLILGGLIFFHWPESSNYALGIYLGIKLMIDGAMLSLTAYTVRKSAGSI
ncbi:MAG: DUF308 domain-containing protein [Bacteroidales bacterium]|nr:DUF308 domain-containing protein [Bacteroidales bacterium]